MRKKGIFFEMIIFYFFIAIFDFIAYITLVKKIFSSYRSQGSSGDVMFGLREPYTVRKIETFLFFPNE